MENEILLETLEKSNSLQCANEVNEIMKKYNCYFCSAIVIDQGYVTNNVIIKEKKE